jgi:hypothetical protein
MIKLFVVPISVVVLFGNLIAGDGGTVNPISDHIAFVIGVFVFFVIIQKND